MKQIKTDPNAKSLLKKIVIFTGGALLIVILIVKPTGLFGEKTTDKV